jgi:succinoglycan biosynthesis protein ExoA
MILSVIVPCRNEKLHIREFLHSVLAQELEPDWELEVLIADGMSDDGTRDILRQHSRVRLIDNPRGIVSTGLNSAIRAATGEIIIRMDVHTSYAPDYIRECVRVLTQSGASNVGGPWVAKGRGVLGEAIAATFQSRFCSGAGRSHNPSYEGEVDTVYLGCWPRSVFERTGMFDESLVRNQDDEFNLRLRRLGGTIWQSPRIQSVYSPRGSLAALFRQYVQYGFWKVRVIRKHRTIDSWRHLCPAIFVGSILLSLVVIALSAMVGLAKVALVIGIALAAELAVYMLACVVSEGLADHAVCCACVPLRLRSRFHPCHPRSPHAVAKRIPGQRLHLLNSMKP